MEGIYSNQCFSYHNRVKILALFYHFAESGGSESAWHSSHGFQHIRGTCLEEEETVYQYVYQYLYH